MEEHLSVDLEWDGIPVGVMAWYFCSFRTVLRKFTLHMNGAAESRKNLK